MCSEVLAILICRRRTGLMQGCRYGFDVGLIPQRVPSQRHQKELMRTLVLDCMSRPANWRVDAYYPVQSDLGGVMKDGSTLPRIHVASIHVHAHWIVVWSGRKIASLALERGSMVAI